ncbi:MAG: M48 family metalloprotease [Blastocatellia bacterium]
MFELLGFCLFLAALLTLNALLAPLATWLWQRLVRHPWSSAGKARVIFSLRIAPVMISLVLALAVVLPAYWLHEPRQKVEPISFKLALLTAFAGVGVLLALWRGLRAWRVTRRLVQNWLQHATRIDVAGVALPAYRIAHPYPVVALVGCWRPRLFLAEQLCQVLTPAELTATIAHESGHWHARDNLKRILLRVCCDVLAILPAGRSLERAWAEAAEVAADEFAARTGNHVAVDLASALVKIARLIPPGVRVALPVGTAIVGPDAVGIAPRVQALLQWKPQDAGRNQADAVFAWLGWVGFAGLLALFSVWPGLLFRVHQLTEFVLAYLQ